MIAADLHVHTCYSFDSRMSLDDLVRACARAHIDCVAVTDHGRTEGALRLRDDGRLRVIVGQEVLTTDGELIGLFLAHDIPTGLAPLDAIRNVKDQGGLVCIPHPLGRRSFPRGASIGSGMGLDFVPSLEVHSHNALLTQEVLSAIDMVEAINARTPFASTWDAARRLADARDLPRSAGSDAHTAGEVGNAYVEMEGFTGPESFLLSLANARLHGRRSSLLVHVNSTIAKLRRNPC